MIVSCFLSAQSALMTDFAGLMLCRFCKKCSAEGLFFRNFRVGDGVQCIHFHLHYCFPLWEWDTTWNSSNLLPFTRLFSYLEDQEYSYYKFLFFLYAKKASDGDKSHWHNRKHTMDSHPIWNRAISTMQATLAPPVAGKMLKGLLMCYAVIFVTFYSAALSGYWAFGNQSNSNILKSLMPDEGPSLAPTWLLGLAIVFVLLQLFAIGLVSCYRPVYLYTYPNLWIFSSRRFSELIFGEIFRKETILERTYSWISLC